MPGIGEHCRFEEIQGTIVVEKGEKKIMKKGSFLWKKIGTLIIGETQKRN